MARGTRRPAHQRHAGRRVRPLKWGSLADRLVLAQPQPHNGNAERVHAEQQARVHVIHRIPLYDIKSAGIG